LVALQGKLVFNVVPDTFIERFRNKCKNFFPRASAFLTKEEKEMKLATPPPSSGEIIEKATNGPTEHLANDKPAGDHQRKSAPEKSRLPNAVCSKPEKALENGNPDVKECFEIA